MILHVALVTVGVVLSVVIDKLVRNMIVGKASKVHSLSMFVSVIGGIQFFGLIGIVAGPLVIPVAVTLLETYRSDTAELGPIAAIRSEKQGEVVPERTSDNPCCRE